MRNEEINMAVTESTKKAFEIVKAYDKALYEARQKLNDELFRLGRETKEGLGMDGELSSPDALVSMFCDNLKAVSHMAAEIQWKELQGKVSDSGIFTMLGRMMFLRKDA